MVYAYIGGEVGGGGIMISNHSHTINTSQYMMTSGFY